MLSLRSIHTIFAALFLSSAVCFSQENLVMRVLTTESKEDMEVLRTRCDGFSDKEIASDDFKLLARKMIATVTSPEQDGVGIAGPQVGVSKRIVAVMRYDKEDQPFEVYPNVKVTAARGEKEFGPEGCLSVPGRRGDVLRWQDIDITYTDPVTLKMVTERIQGYTAVIFQHECDHLDGILYIDYPDTRMSK